MLSRLLRGATRAARSSSRALATATDWEWWGATYGDRDRTAAGVPVDEAASMSLAAVYRAISVLAETSCTLPLHLYRKGAGNSVRQRADEHPAQQLVDRPNPIMDGMTWREYMTVQLVGRGNAYSEIVWGLGTDQQIRPVALWPIPSAQVKPRLREGTFAKYYEVNRPDGKQVILEADEVLHLRGKGDILEGWSVLKLARETIGLGLGSEKMVGAQLGNANRPAGILKFARKPSPDAIDEFRKGWKDRHEGAANAGKLGFIWGEQVDFLQTAISNEDAQLLQERQFTVTEIARFFGVPPHLLYDLARATFSNIEQQGLEYLAYTLAYWLRKWELGLAGAVLIEADAGLFFEHTTQALLKTDTETRYRVYSTARQWGLLDANEIRAKENEPPRPDGEGLILPSGSTAAAALFAEEEEEPDEPPPPEPPTEEDEDEPEEDALAVRRAWLADVMGRMLRKEMTAVAKLAKDPTTFLRRADEFYAHHIETCSEALKGAVPENAGRPVVAAHHCRLSFEALVEASGRATPATLEAVIAETMRDWPARAETFAREVLP